MSDRQAPKKSDGGTPDPTQILNELRKQLDPKSPWYPILGKLTVGYILVTLAILAIEITYGLPIVTVANAGVVGGLIVFLWGSVEAWLLTDKPDVIFFACSNPSCKRVSPFIRVEWAELPKFRKWKSCPECGARLIKRCQSGKHLIVHTPDADKESVPQNNAICPYCSPVLQVDERRYVPMKGERCVWLPRSWITPWRQRYKIANAP